MELMSRRVTGRMMRQSYPLTARSMGRNFKDRSEMYTENLISRN